jgi:hypothetical protein
MVEEQWTQHLRDTNQHFCVVAEEFTTWTDNIVEPMPDDCDEDKWKPDQDFIGRWFRCAMTESRKQLMIPLFVAHDRTMEILAKAKGLSKLRDAALLEVELIATIDPITTEAKASGQGKIKLPGHGQWIDIELPKLDQKRIDFRLDESVISDAQSNTKKLDPKLSTDSEIAERIWQLEFNLDKPSVGDDIQENKPQLSAMAQHLLDWLKDKLTATANDVQTTYKIAKHIKPNTVPKILELFAELHQAELAEYDGDRTIRLL